MRMNPTSLNAVSYAKSEKQNATSTLRKAAPAAKALVGSDVFVAWTGDIDAIGQQMKALEGDGLELKMLSNKGLKVWPDVSADGMHITDQFRCRFRMPEGQTTTHKAIAALLSRAEAAGIDFTKTENLYTFDGALGFSLGQGE